MQDGFVKVAARTPEVRVADVAHNVRAILEEVRCTCEDDGARVVVLPELCVTAYSCGDLFWQSALLDASERAVAQIARETAAFDAIIFFGVPLRVNNKLYNCAVAVCSGEVLGIVPKYSIPTYNEFYEGRYFVSGPLDPAGIDLPLAGLTDISFGARQLFCCETVADLKIAAELCEDLWVPMAPSIEHAQAGATLIVNLSASDALVGKAAYRRSLVVGQSARLICAYIYASAGEGESTQDVVYSAHDLIAENGTLLAEGVPFGEGCATSEIDVAMLAAERQRMSTFPTTVSPWSGEGCYSCHRFSLEPVSTPLTRLVDAHPFVPDDVTTRAQRCEDVLSIQAHGLARRLMHTRSTCVVIGISGGLDSTLALLVTARAFDLVGLDREGILAITMPGFGTSDRTHSNAQELADVLGATLREVSIAEAVRQHFADIGHDESVHDVTYENAQARERTQILMDMANQAGGLVIGTGDLSELALGWATYNGDHMSMYGVNAGVPKTLVRHLVHHVADTSGSAALARILLDVLDTPVSPELLPAQSDGSIAQKTEDLVGPYELHDFFLYQVLRHGFSPAKTYRLARYALGDRYDATTTLQWLKTFYRRFFSQQFKRSCLPDGPKVGSVAVSPRGDLRMPSDASVALWAAEAEKLV